VDSLKVIFSNKGNKGWDGQHIEFGVLPIPMFSTSPHDQVFRCAGTRALVIGNFGLMRRDRFDGCEMIQYLYKKPKILFVGINPHFGSFERGVPFSNNKLFWYLLGDAGIIEERRDELRNDEALKRMYQEKFNAVYGLGLVNIINRPTQDVTKLVKGEELPGRKRVLRIIKAEIPKVTCFIGKVSYQKYSGSKNFSFGWQDRIGQSQVFVMHFPLRGEAIIRIRELREIAGAAQG